MKTETGRQIRLYYRKIEALAKLMHEYIVESNLRIMTKRLTASNEALAEAEQKRLEAVRLAEAEQKRADDATARANESDRIMGRIKKATRGPNVYKEDSVYLASNDVMQADHLYKFGITSQLPIDRENQYSVGYTDQLALKMIYIGKSRNARAVENAFRTTIHAYIVPRKNEKDIFSMPAQEAIDILEILITAIDASCDRMIRYEENIELSIDKPPFSYTNSPSASTEEKKELKCPNPWCGKLLTSEKRVNNHVVKCVKPEPKKGNKHKKITVTAVIETDKESATD